MGAHAHAPATTPTASATTAAAAPAAPHRAGRAPYAGAQLPIAQHPLQQPPQAGVIHLPRKVLEEAIELLQVAVRDGQEGGEVGLCPLLLPHARARPQL